MTHSLKQVIDTLRDIATEMPTEQTECFYSKEGAAQRAELGNQSFVCKTAATPMCVIGHLVYRLDGPEALPKLTETLGIYDQPEVFAELGYTDEALSIMDKAQTLHDEGANFLSAVGEAIEGA